MNKFLLTSVAFTGLSGFVGGTPANALNSKECIEQCSETACQNDINVAKDCSSDKKCKGAKSYTRAGVIWFACRKAMVKLHAEEKLREGLEKTPETPRRAAPKPPVERKRVTFGKELEKKIYDPKAAPEDIKKSPEEVIRGIEEREREIREIKERQREIKERQREIRERERMKTPLPTPARPPRKPLPPLPKRAAPQQRIEPPLQRQSPARQKLHEQIQTGTELRHVPKAERRRPAKPDLKKTETNPSQRSSE